MRVPVGQRWGAADNARLDEVGKRRLTLHLRRAHVILLRTVRMNAQMNTRITERISFSSFLRAVVYPPSATEAVGVPVSAVHTGIEPQDLL